MWALCSPVVTGDKVKKINCLPCNINMTSRTNMVQNGKFFWSYNITVMQRSNKHDKTTYIITKNTIQLTTATRINNNTKCISKKHITTQQTCNSLCIMTAYNVFYHICTPRFSCCIEVRCNGNSHNGRFAICPKLACAIGI